MTFDPREIPRTASVLVEGGHYTPRPFPVHLEGGAVELTEPGTYLVVVDRDAPRVAGELVRGLPHIRIPNLVPVYVEVVSGRRVVFDAQCPAREVLKFAPPSPTELATLSAALELAAELGPQADRVQVGILIGNMQMPVGIRHHVRELLPRIYRDLIEDSEFHGEVELFSESACRNKGTAKVVDLARRAIRDDERLSLLYSTRGVTVFQDDDECHKALYLCSEFTVSETFEAPSLVPLTRGPTVPACGTTLAGRLHLAWEQGFTDVVSIYSAADDDEIRRKNVEGSVIAASLFPDDYALSTYHLTQDVTQGQVLDAFTAPQLRRPGCRPGGAESLERVACANDGTFGFSAQRATSPVTCCPYKPMEVRRRGRPR